MADITNKPEHLLILEDRNRLNINGILEVISFDECSVSLKTVCGELFVEGKELHISELDTSKGAVTVDGNVESLSYYDIRSEERKSRFGFFGR